MKIAAVIIAGGRSSRMGREKAFEIVGEQTILERIISKLRPQVQALAINANGMAERFSAMGFPVIADLRSDVGTPLAGLHTAIHFAGRQGFDAILTVPSDSPFLPDDLALRLAGANAPATIAASNGQDHFITGLWSPVLLPRLGTALDQPRLPRLQDWSRRVGAVTIQWPTSPYDPFFNVNTPEDLAEANRIAAEFGA